MHTRSRRTAAHVAVAVGLATGLAVTALATALYAAALESDGASLRTKWRNGGDALLELEERNAEPLICFAWKNDAPQDGDSFESRVVTLAGAVVLDLGTADQWIDGVGEGCEIAEHPDYRDVFANPSKYFVEFHVVDDQGTARTGPVRSEPLERTSG